jgi:peptidoglycan-associated lipoprotein
MNRGLTALSFLFVAASALAFTACTPPYPKCKEDKHCKERPTPKTDKLMWCVQGMCVECRDPKDCEEGFKCEAGACAAIPGYCSANKPCPKDQVCRNNRCGPECSAEFPCPAGQKCDANKCVPDVDCSTNADCKKKYGDAKPLCDNNVCIVEPACGARSSKKCPPGQQCEGEKCVDIPGYCDANKPCPPGQECKDNRCVQSEVKCELGPVYFDFDKSEVRDDQKQAVSTNADCIKKKLEKKQAQKVMIAGHCDERGTKEYNIALGERRWKALKDAYVAAGVAADSIEGISYGEEKPTCSEHKEDCWSKNRRSESSFK